MTAPDTLVEATLDIEHPMLVAYGALTCDSNPIHLDAGFAATTPYGRCIAHGTLSLNVLWQSIAATFDMASAACLDLDIRFSAPVFVGERLVGGGTRVPGTDTRYEVLNSAVNKGWIWQRGEGKGMSEANGFTCTSTDLSRALRRHPHLRVLAASGRYDLGTPYSASDWSLAQLDVPADVMARVTHRYYDAGHMFYTRSDDLRQFAADLAQWLGVAT